MADETEAKEEKKGGGSFLTLLLVAILAIGAGAGGTFALLGSRGAAPPPEEVVPEKPEDSAEQAAEDFRARLYTLEPFVVNVSDEGFQRYLKVKVDLELDDVEARNEIEARTPQVRDTIIVLLTSKRLADVTNFEGKALLKEELLERVNSVLQQARVDNVLFTEFVIQ